MRCPNDILLEWTFGCPVLVLPCVRWVAQTCLSKTFSKFMLTLLQQIDTCGLVSLIPVRVTVCDSCSETIQHLTTWSAPIADWMWRSHPCKRLEIVAFPVERHRIAGSVMAWFTNARSISLMLWGYRVCAHLYLLRQVFHCQTDVAPAPAQWRIQPFPNQAEEVGEILKGISAARIQTWHRWRVCPPRNSKPLSVDEWPIWSNNSSRPASVARLYHHHQ